eukprot:TRINITY_DN908_c0_g1_i1.p1 TRINITY_DN908_c0_g1~~TRINITY_DN908_c0_g1_i1.p1  ORF type:complete len:734 (+),score=373.72 TRINITY_DN908_c0_g1_i1:36-2204(+)
MALRLMMQRSLRTSPAYLRTFSTSSVLYADGMFDKILIANRGEIACRVIRTARRLGVRTVAVYSDADQNSLHVKLADEAVRIGPPEVAQSYLLGNTILEAAKSTGAQAVHPGYGFLSENADFSELCHSNNIVFIGPPASAIRQMGSKSASKEIMENAKVPIIPGYHGAAQDMETFRREAAKIKYPIMIKAVMGGGGRGMRVCNNEAELEELIESAQRESASAFGDSTILLEKYITHPRHIELQVFADTHGNCVYVFERDCSVQRRNQKVIEEAPAPLLTEERRKLMGEAAVNAAKAVGYVGAGTVEFIVDTNNPDPNTNFYFMEMNTRLQVEHPITEMISKQDLVEWQLRVASGQVLPAKQSDLKIHGHAFESRIYAEDPSKGFIPGYGKINHLATPEPSEFVRIDSGVVQGDQISTYYDNMIAKLIVWDQDRDRALKRMRLALDQYQVIGLTTNTSFLKRVVDHPAFIKGGVTTKFIPEYEKDLIPQAKPAEKNCIAIASVARILKDVQELNKKASTSKDPHSPFLASPSEVSFRLNHGSAARHLHFVDLETNISVKASQTATGSFLLDITRTHSAKGSHPVHESAEISASFTDKQNQLQVIIDGHRFYATVVQQKDDLHVFYDGKNGNHFVLSIPVLESSEAVVEKGSLLSPMPGTVKKVFVKDGDHVKKGQVLVIVYAMKTELPIKAAADGVIKKVLFKENEIVEAGTMLLTMKDEAEE